MKTPIFVITLAVSAALPVAVAEETKSTLGEKTSQTLEKAGEKVKDAGHAIAEGTRKTVDTVKDAVTPDKDARSVEVKLTEHHIAMPKQLGTGKTAFVVHNIGKEQHNFEIEGPGLDKKFLANLGPDETRVLHVDLKEGTYHVLCPVKDHASEGMKLDLTVK